MKLNNILKALKKSLKRDSLEAIIEEIWVNDEIIRRSRFDESLTISNNPYKKCHYKDYEVAIIPKEVWMNNNIIKHKWISND